MSGGSSSGTAAARPGGRARVYRVAQESLTNVARHAQATAVLLSLEGGIGSVVLRVVDDGRGFDGGHAEGGGLRGIRERALIVGGAPRSSRARRRRRGAARGPRGKTLNVPTPLVTRILVADDHALVRDGLKHVLNAEPDLEVVAEAADGAEAVERALAEDIHLAILDISMPRMTGLQAADELAQRRPELRLLMLSMYDNEQFLFEALKAGASGYVLKSGADDDIVKACRAAVRGESFLYPSAVNTLVRDFVERPTRKRPTNRSPHASSRS